MPPEASAAARFGASAAGGAVRSRCRATGAGPARPGGGGPIDLDLEALAGDLDGVLLLELRRLSVSGLLDLRERERLEPGAVLDQVTARLRIRPLRALQDRLVERQQRLQPTDLILTQRPAPCGAVACSRSAVPDDQLADHRVIHR